MSIDCRTHYKNAPQLFQSSFLIRYGFENLSRVLALLVVKHLLDTDETIAAIYLSSWTQYTSRRIMTQKQLYQVDMSFSNKRNAKNISKTQKIVHV